MDTDKVILRFVRRGRRPRRANTTLKEKNKVERPILPGFESCYKAPIIKTVCSVILER